MKIALNTSARKWLAAGICSILATTYCGLATSLFSASWFENRADLSSLERAVSLDRGNAEFRNHLGRYYDLVARDPSSAITHYQAAVAINPHSARYWFDLASAYQVLGDAARQTDALEHAIQADATTPDVAWEAANLYLVQGENAKALRELRVVIANDPSLSAVALPLCWRILPDMDSLLRDVVPDRSDAYLSLLKFLETRQETEGAKKVWQSLMQAPGRFDAENAYEYVRYMILHKEVDQAVQAWQQTAARFNLSAYLPSSENLVANGNFNLTLLNAGFDWQYKKQSSVTLSMDASDFHAGRRSLQITFDGPGISDAGLYQFIAVQPGTQYTFTAYYKNGEMEGAGGPRFEIQDVYGKTVYYQSEELKDAGFWKSANGEFTTAPDAKLVLLHIPRVPAGSPIRGKLWVSDFHLVKKPS